MEFNCLEDTEPLRRDSLLFNIRSPGLPDTQLTSEVILEATQDPWSDPGLGNPAP